MKHLGAKRGFQAQVQRHVGGGEIWLLQEPQVAPHGWCVERGATTGRDEARGQFTNDHEWQVKEFDIHAKGQFFETIFTSLHTQKNDSFHTHI